MNKPFLFLVLLCLTISMASCTQDEELLQAPSQPALSGPLVSPPVPNHDTGDKDDDEDKDGDKDGYSRPVTP